jgi:hypothetical protein
MVDCGFIDHTSQSDDLLSWFSAHLVIDGSAVAQMLGKAAKIES